MLRIYANHPIFGQGASTVYLEFQIFNVLLRYSIGTAVILLLNDFHMTVGEKQGRDFQKRSRDHGVPNLNISLPLFVLNVPAKLCRLNCLMAIFFFQEP